MEGSQAMSIYLFKSLSAQSRRQTVAQNLVGIILEVVNNPHLSLSFMLPFDFRQADLSTSCKKQS